MADFSSYAISQDHRITDGGCDNAESGFHVTSIHEMKSCQNGFYVILIVRVATYSQSLPGNRCLHTTIVLWEEIKTSIPCEEDEPLSDFIGWDEYILQGGPPFSLGPFIGDPETLPPIGSTEPPPAGGACKSTTTTTFHSECKIDGDGYWLFVWRSFEITLSIPISPPPNVRCYVLFFTQTEEPVKTVRCDPDDEWDEETISELWEQFIRVEGGDIVNSSKKSLPKNDSLENSHAMDGSVEQLRFTIDSNPVSHKFFEKDIAEIKAKDPSIGTGEDFRSRKIFASFKSSKNEILKDFSSLNVNDDVFLEFEIEGSRISTKKKYTITKKRSNLNEDDQ